MIQNDPFSIQKIRYMEDVKFIASMPRVSGTEHHKAVQNLCMQRLKKLGFKVEKQQYGSGVNVIGIYPGKQSPSEKIVVSAHYDTLPNCNGADDNASGVAGVLETARLLVTEDYNRTLVVACWDEEEKKTLGSRQYVSRDLINNSDIKMSFVYEMIAYQSEEPETQTFPAGFDLLYPKQVQQIKQNKSRGDFILLVYDDLASAWVNSISGYAAKQELPLIKIEVTEKLKKSSLVKDLRRSDHAPFWDADYPAMMITDTANFRNKNYHCLNGEDNVESLNVDFAIKTVNTVTKTIVESLNKRLP